jgi:hypothetical protein
MKKLGKIFNPTEHKLANDCTEFAQSPQALVFDHFVRIYFSTREKDLSGKFLSHIAFVDMDKDFKKIIAISTNTVIPLGALGCFDEHGIFPISPMRHGDKIFAYTCGWSRRVSVPVETSIGLAISSDEGLTFDRLGNGPVMSSSLKEPFLVGDAFVRVYKNTFHMWYIYGTSWTKQQQESPVRIYKIAHATSSDGINWNRDNKRIIQDRLDPDECQALPSVVFHHNRYHMFFCYRRATDFRKNKSRAYRIGYAYSDDLNYWIRDDDKPGLDFTTDAWDSEMQCYPHVFKCNDKIYLLYNGNEFGRFGFGIAEWDDA